MNIELKISIIVSCFNKESLIKYSVNSALSQTYQNCEVIVVDDGSTDNSSDFLAELNMSNPRLTVIRQENLGLSVARNTGLAASIGDYVLFHDGDDILFPEAVAELVDSIRTDTGAVDIIGGVFEKYVNDSARILKAFLDDVYVTSFFEKPEIFWRHFANFSSCNKLFRRDFLLQNDILFLPNLYMQDIDFWFHAVKNAKGIRFTSIPVATYMKTQGSWSTRRTEKRFSSFIELSARLTNLKKGLSLDARASLDGALLQGAGLFFMRWKLREFYETKDNSYLQIIGKLLNDMPVYSFLRYFEYRQNIISFVAYLIRSERYQEALELIDYEKTVQPNQLKLCSKLSVSDDDNKRVMDGLLSQIKEQIPTANAELESEKMHVRNPIIKEGGFRNYANLNILVFGLGNLYNAGGVQLSYQHLFQHLVDQGNSVTFYSHWAEKPDEDFYYTYDQRIAFGFYKLNEQPANIKNIRKIAQETNPDVILIVNSAQNALVLVSALYDLPYPVVLSERGGADHCLEHSWATKLQRQVAHGAVEYSHMLMESYHTAVHPALVEYVRFIPSGIPMTEKRADTATAAENGMKTVLYTGRLAFEKDLDLLLKAFSNLATEFPDWQLRITGDGPEKQSLEALKSNLNCKSQISFDGSIQDSEILSEIYQSSHIFVLPSRAEGCPLSLREAFSYGLPSIGFASCSGTNEIIQSNVNGLLASVDNKEMGLTNELRKLMQSKDLRKKLGDQAAIDASKYSLEAVFQKTEQLLIDAAQWRSQRQRLRVFKRHHNSNSYNYLETQFRKIKKKGKARNIYMFELAKRLKGLDQPLIAAYCMIYGGCLFDWQWYLKQNLSVKLSGQDPLTHYLTKGWKQGLAPSPDFDVAFYRKKYMEKSKKSCPLTHFYLNGRYKGCVPSANTSKKLLKQITEELKQENITCGQGRSRIAKFSMLISKLPFVAMPKIYTDKRPGFGQISKKEFKKIIGREIVWSRMGSDAIRLIIQNTSKFSKNKKARVIKKFESLPY